MTWRVGSKVPINVYEVDRPVCQCQTPDDARRIVAAMNAASQPSGAYTSGTLRTNAEIAQPSGITGELAKCRNVLFPGDPSTCQDDPCACLADDASATQAEPKCRMCGEELSVEPGSDTGYRCDHCGDTDALIADDCVAPGIAEKSR
jgi:hypothetical protein